MSNVHDKLISSRLALLIKEPFFGNISTRMKYIDASDWCPTAATDGINFYYNEEFFNKLEVPEVEFIICHEILHCIFDHIGRFKNTGKIHKIVNVAQDYAVNQILVDEGIGKIPNNAYQNNIFKGMFWEEIYDIILNKCEFIDVGELIDVHLDDSGSGDKSKEGINISTDQLEKNQKEMIKNMIESYQASSKIPQIVQKIINNYLFPKMNWKQILQNNVQALIKNDYSFNKINRKSMCSGIILPGLTNDESIDICVAIDSSGSITNEQASQFLSEIKSITEQYSEFIIHVWSFDTDVHNHTIITPNDIDLLDSYQVMGGGGTEFECNFEYLKNHSIVPKLLIVFTDGYPNASWGDADYCETIFAIQGNSSIIAPFGLTLHIT